MIMLTIEYEDMDTNGFEALMKELKSADSSYMCFDRKEDMLFLMSRTERQCLLVDKRNKSFVELVDKDGNMVAFTLKDVDKTEAATKLLLASQNLEASYAVLQQAMSLSLLDYIK